MAKQILDFRPRRVLSEEESDIILRRADKFTIRKVKAYRTYNPKRSYLNFEIDADGKVVEVDDSLVTRIEKNLAGRGVISPVKDAAKSRRKTMMHFMFSASPEWMQKFAFGDQEIDFSPDAPFEYIDRTTTIEGWAKKLRKFLGWMYGKENVVAVVAHLDIYRPEVIAIVLAVGSNKHFSFNAVFAGQDKFEYRRRSIRTHDMLYYLINRELGLERGMRQSVSDGHLYNVSQASFESLLNYHSQQANLIASKRNELNKLLVDESAADTKVKSLTTMLENLNSRKDELTLQISSYDTQTELENQEKERRIYLYEEEIKKVLKQISERQDQLTEARKQLQAAADRKAVLKEQYEELQKKQKLASEFKERNRTALHDMQTLIMDCLKEDILSLDKLAYSLKLNESLRTRLQEIVGGFSEFVSLVETARSVAEQLYIGNISKANNIVKEHEGTAIPISFRRKVGESDKTFLEVCFTEAQKSLKLLNYE